jgi:PKD repeat protein
MYSEVSLLEQKVRMGLVAGFLLFLATHTPAANTALIGWSETGLHEIDGTDVSVYCLAPPYSTIHAQLVSGGFLVTNPAGFEVTYQAIADASGSINSTSQGKGNFSQYAEQLFGIALKADEGVAGFSMPGISNQPQLMSFDSTQHCFTAQGIPVTPYDDQGNKNFYPMMRLTVRDSTNNVLSTTDIVVPVSDEMDCRACHQSGAQLEARPPSGWAWNVDPQKDYKLNILQSHDDHLLGGTTYSNVLYAVGYNQRGLVATVMRDGHPVLCVRCHNSAALPGTGAPGMRPLTQLMHTKHSFVTDPQSGSYLTYSTNSSACLLCHAGPENRLMRGVHHNTINTNGALAMQCQSCHGSIGAVGTPGRQGWLDEPLCQSCHTGTAVTNSGALRFTSVFDSLGQVRRPADLTYATQTNAPVAGVALFHSSQGHGGINCAACHGPAHAEWLSTQPNDNVQSQQLQSPTGGGVLTACSVCHPVTPVDRTGGPHGMHPVDSNWAFGHDGYSRTTCQNCHGIDYRGTPISWSQGVRNYSAIGEQFWHGFQTGCYVCHAGPVGGDTGAGNPNSPATVNDLSVNATSGVPISVTLIGSDPNGDPVTFRIVSQPAHGTVSLSGKVATFFPDPAFVGSDLFTYAAWDGSTDSALGTVTLATLPGSCLLTANAMVPTAAFPASPVAFRAFANVSQCAATVTYDWDFGDHTPHGTGANVSHVYTNAADYTWTFTVIAGSAVQKAQGTLTISPTLGKPLLLTVTSLGFLINLSWLADTIPASLETATDLTQPYAWQPDLDPIYFDGTNNNVQVFLMSAEQLFRLRRLP